MGGNNPHDRMPRPRNTPKEDRKDPSNTAILNSSAKDALRATFLLNGGAAVATLSFLGSVSDGQSILDISGIVNALWFYSLGLGFCVLAYGADYLNMMAWRHHIDLGSFTSTLVAFLLAGGSIVMFFVGSYVFASTVVPQ